MDDRQRIKRVHYTALLIPSLLLLIIAAIGAYKANGNGGSHYAVLHVEPGKSQLLINSGMFIINGWDTGSVTYFFLPSFANVKAIEQNDSEWKIYMPDGSLLTDPRIGEEQSVNVIAPDGNQTAWNIAFMKSENLCTISVATNGDEYTDIDRSGYSAASMTIMSVDGKNSYSSNDILIRGRGNETWHHDKKPFQIKLTDDASLCGMSSSNKWVLLANRADATKMKNKLAFDMSDLIGMEYSIESDWVDLYINNEYVGNYILCHEPAISGTDLDINNLQKQNKAYFDEPEYVMTSEMKGYAYKAGPIIDGGYLVEKQIASYYDKKKCGFAVGEYDFSIKSPDNASMDQVSYISECMKNVNLAIEENRNLQEKIDYYSFSRRYIIEEMSQNPDATLTSYYFYKKPRDSRIYAGPNWDYDVAFGHSYPDYNTNAIEIGEMKGVDEPALHPLKWDKFLIEDEEYHEYVKNVLQRYLPILEKALPGLLDGYYEKIYSSIKMDYIKWGSDEYYESFDSNYRYLRYFLCKRVEHIADEYGLNADFSALEMNDVETHTIEFIYPDGNVVELYVNDGEILPEEEIPRLDSDKYRNWARYTGDTPRYFSSKRPIYEDMVFETISHGIDNIEEKTEG